MTRRSAITPTAGTPRQDWRKTNPGYQYGPPKHGKVNGEPVVWIDGGKLADMALMGQKRK